MNFDKALYLRMYENLILCRYFDEVSLTLFEEGLTPGRMHSYIGEEAIAVGAVLAMEKQDQIVSTHRGGSHLVARGADIQRVYMEYMGRAGGYSGGKGGPMHLSVPELGFLCTNGIVGSGIPIAVGAAMASKMKNESRVVLCFFGDGAANTGSFHEGINMAAIWKLPVIFICENNCYAETLPVEKGIAVKDISSRAGGYGIYGSTIDGNNVEEVYKEVHQRMELARSGDGPSFIEMKTYRMEQHFSGESNHYRTKQEMEDWKKKDPIDLFKNIILQAGVISIDELEQIENEVRNSVEAAAAEAKRAEFPSIDSLCTHVMNKTVKGEAS